MEAFESLYKNVLVKGRQLDIREVEPKQESDTVLIKNLDFLTTEREIKYFLKQSKIDYKELNFVVNKRGKSKGFCFI
jgi:RNA recognition motif-containing protein